MKKKLIISFVVLLLVTFGLSGVVSAATSVYSATRGATFSYQATSSASEQTISLRLLEVMDGLNADREITASSFYNPSASNGKEWFLFHFTVDYISGSGSLSAAKLFNGIDEKGVYFDPSGNKLDITRFAAFEYKHAGNNAYKINLLPGQSADIWVGILVEDMDGYPVMKVPASINGSFSSLWFSLSPDMDSSTIYEAPNSLYLMSTTYSTIRFGWNKLNNVTNYTVYRATSSSGAFRAIGTTKTTDYTDTGLTPGVLYYYKVKATYVDGGKTVVSGYSTAFSARPVLSAPAGLKVAKASSSSAVLNWEVVSGASGYEIYRATAYSDTFTKIATVTGTSYTNGGLKDGETYVYKMRAYRTNGSAKAYGNFSGAVAISFTAPMAAPTRLAAASYSYNCVKVSWAPVSGANGYALFQATSANGYYSQVGTTTQAYIINPGVITNKTYYYKVKAYKTVNGAKVYGISSSIVSAKAIPAAVTGLKATRASSTSIKTTWTKQTGASGYTVFRSTSKTGTYKAVASCVGNSYTNSKLSKSTTYYYKVKSYRLVSGVRVYGVTSAVAYART